MKDAVIGIVGCGNMGEAIARGLIAAGHDPRKILASHPRAERRAELAASCGIRVTDSNEEVPRVSAVTLLAVKPQILPAVLEAIATAATGRLLVSLAAGTPHATLRAALPGARVVRSMPNQPSAVRAGVTGLWADGAVTDEDRRLVTAVFDAIGLSVWLPKEDLFHALTAVSGCGPGFLYAVAEALADGGVAAGLPRAMARRLAAFTIAGAGKTLVESAEHPAELKDKVASPAGATIAGLAALEKAGVRGGIIAAVRASAARSVEMAAGGTPRIRHGSKARTKRATATPRRAVASGRETKRRGKAR